ncbi:MAG: hypothetical protein AAFX45_01575 [Pseudomonadota bacterium]
MKWKIAVAVVGFLMFSVPFLAINLGALGMQARVERIIGGTTSVPDPVADAGDQVLNIWGNFREGREIDALFVADNFTRRRSITYTETLSIDDLLAEGETPPAPAFEDLWMIARAPGRAMDRECPIVLETIGRACAVSTAKVEKTDEPGIYDIEAVVGYLPDHDLGSTAVEGQRDLYRARIRLPARRGIAVPPDGRGAVKRSLYQEIERACDDVRERRGNCVISELTLREGRTNDNGTVEYYATANLYTVGPKGSGQQNDDLVGTYGATFAENQTGIEENLGILGSLSALLGLGEKSQTASRGDGPRIIRGGHNRYGGSDGRFIPARDR